WIRNDGRAPVKFSYMHRMDEGLRMWATDEKGLRFETNITRYDSYPVIFRVRLEPGELLQWIAVKLVMESRERDKNSVVPATLSLSSGKYQFHIEGRIGSTERRNAKGEVDVPA